MIQGCCYSGTEPHQQQHHPSGCSSSTAAKRAAPGSLSHSAAELARRTATLASAREPFSRPLSASERRRASSASAPPPRNQTSTQARGARCLIHAFLSGSAASPVPFLLGGGDCTVFSICRVFIAWNRTIAMALRRKGKRHVQFWPVMGSLMRRRRRRGGGGRLQRCLAKQGFRC